VKRRYLALKIEADESIEEEDLKDAIWDALIKLFGEYGASRSGLFLIQFDKKKGEAVLRCWHVALPMIHAAVASIIEIRDRPAAVHVISVSGTLRALRKKTSGKKAIVDSS